MENARSNWVVSPDDDRTALATAVRKATGQPWSTVKRWIHTGKVTVDGEVVTDPGQRIRAGQTVMLCLTAPRRTSPFELQPDAIRYLDTHLVIVNKPSGISTVPYEPGERGTLVDRVRVLLHRQGRAPANAPLFVVHRIDKETSGLVVFGRTWLAKRHLASLFRAHTIERIYLALVNGHLSQHRITYDSYLVENRGDGLRGSAKQPGFGVRAITHVEAIARLHGPVTLVRCRLETGRTHQIRIHLSEAGHPLVGERVYVRFYQGPQCPAPRVMLHAATLAFSHPVERDRIVRVVSPPPDDFHALACSLGATENHLHTDG